MFILISHTTYIYMCIYDLVCVCVCRISCLLNLQRYNECLVLIMKELEEDASSPDLYVLRAHLNLMFGDVSMTLTRSFVCVPSFSCWLSNVTSVSDWTHRAAYLSDECTGIRHVLFYMALLIILTPSPPQTTQAYHDVCRVLELDERHSDALMLLRQLEGKGQQCRDQVLPLAARVCACAFDTLQAVGSMLVGKKVDALKKITTAIENNPSVADYHVFRSVHCSLPPSLPPFLPPSLHTEGQCTVGLVTTPQRWMISCWEWTSVAISWTHQPTPMLLDSSL